MTERPTRGAGPLDGLLVLDFSRVLSGPHCGRMLADMGADVIKVEPPEGDMTRYSFPRVNSIATYFTQQNCGKRNISLDLKQPRAVALLHTMARRVDVVLENFRPGVMGRMGLGYDVLSAENAALVYASITGYGQSGPWKRPPRLRAGGRRRERPDLGAGHGARRRVRQRRHLARRRLRLVGVPGRHPGRPRPARPHGARSAHRRLDDGDAARHQRARALGAVGDRGRRRRAQLQPRRLSRPHRGRRPDGDRVRPPRRPRHVRALRRRRSAGRT